MGSLVEEAIRAAIAALVAHDAGAARGHRRGRRINEMQREVSGMITRTIATQSPVARDLRFLLALDHVALRAGADGRPRGVGRQAGPQARAASRR